MRRTILLLTGVLLAVVPLGSDSPKEYDDGTVNGGIEGTWQLIKVEGNGRTITLDGFESVTTFLNGTYSQNDSDGDTFRGRYRIDTTCKPPHIDQIPSRDGATLKEIYQIDRDTLKIAYSPLGVQRPQSFKGEGVWVVTYKRVK